MRIGVATACRHFRPHTTQSGQVEPFVIHHSSLPPCQTRIPSPYDIRVSTRTSPCPSKASNPVKPSQTNANRLAKSVFHLCCEADVRLCGSTTSPTQSNPVKPWTPPAIPFVISPSVLCSSKMAPRKSYIVNPKYLTMHSPCASFQVSCTLIYAIFCSFLHLNRF